MTASNTKADIEPGAEAEEKRLDENFKANRDELRKSIWTSTHGPLNLLHKRDNPRRARKMLQNSPTISSPTQCLYSPGHSTFLLVKCLCPASRTITANPKNGEGRVELAVAQCIVGMAGQRESPLKWDILGVTIVHRLHQLRVIRNRHLGLGLLQYP